MARFDMICLYCGYLEEDVEGPMGHIPERYCPRDKGFRVVTPLVVYHGRRGEVPINFGFRESRYTNKTDENIAKYQFEHL